MDIKRFIEVAPYILLAIALAAVLAYGLSGVRIASHKLRDLVVNGYTLTKAERQQYELINGCLWGKESKKSPDSMGEFLLAPFFPRAPITPTGILYNRNAEECAQVFADRKTLEGVEVPIPLSMGGSEHNSRVIKQYETHQLVGLRYSWLTLSIHKGWFPAPEPVKPGTAEFNRRQSNADLMDRFFFQCKNEGVVGLDGHDRCMVYYGWKASGQDWNTFKRALAHKPALITDAAPIYTPPKKPGSEKQVAVMDTSPRALYRVHLANCVQEKAAGQMLDSIERCAIVNGARVARMTPDQFKAAMTR